MTIALMRLIDRYLGVLFCWLLGLPVIFTLARPRASLPAAPERVLVIKFFGMGSIVLTTPAISLLRSCAPEATIDYLTFASNRPLLERYSIIENVLTIRDHSLAAFIVDTFRAVWLLRRKRYDVVLDFEFFSKYSTLLSSLSGSKTRIGFALPAVWRSLHLTHQVPLSKTRHVSEAFCDQVFLLFGRRPIPAPLPPSIHEEDAASMLAKLPLNCKPILAVNVNTGETFLERRWSPQRFAQLVTDLSQHTNHEFYFIGTERERPFVDAVIRGTRCAQRCYNIAGLLTIPELGAFLCRCDLLISNDSGPVHIAAALGVRVVGLYGPELPAFYGPIGAAATVVYKGIACSPCMNIYAAKTFRCPFHAECMKAISVDEVRNAVEQVCLRV